MSIDMIFLEIHTGNYVASAVIDDKTYGAGTATNKKDARQKAGKIILKSTLFSLIIVIQYI